MIRITAIFLLVAFLSIYAYRHWYRSLCGLILLMAIIEHPDLPKSIMDIQGLNPWNVLLANVLLGWLINRKREGLVWDMPRNINVLLLLYLGVVLVGFLRALSDRSFLGDYSIEKMISEELINTVKWVIPGLLLFDGCRSRRRLTLGIICVLAVYFLLAIQVIHWMPPGAALSGDDLEARSRKIILNEIGYHRVNMSMMLSGASWAALSTLALVKRRKYKILVFVIFVMLAYAQALTGGRMGYVTWGMVGLILCLLRWRKYLLLVPLVPIFVAIVLPGTMERMLHGFGEETVVGDTTVDQTEVTAGRTVFWPYVIDKIMEAPIVGYGRLAMVRTGLANYLGEQEGEPVTHPHNAYLEWLLDNGLLGFVFVMPFYAVVVLYAARLFLDSSSPIYIAVGGMTLALVLALLCASMGSQTFYPREGAVGMWAAIGLMMRLSLIQQRSTNPATCRIPYRMRSS